MMTATGERMKAELDRLPAQDRAALAAYLIESLDEEMDPDAEAAWDEELARREAEIRSGQAVGEPADEVFARLRSRIT
jgi:putative addiction module component (TIGR02574 family)